MVSSVVIVGGGTAGWMTASYLTAAFGDRVAVTLVESKNVPALGVGEATFSTIRHFFNYLGLDEREWMPECHGTYKTAVRFEGWREPGHVFYHPFERNRVVDGFPLTDWWVQKKPTGQFDRDSFLIASMCDAQSSPRYLDGSLFDSTFERGDDQRTTLTEQNTQFPYAYHFDAALLAKFLTRYGVARGVRHVLDDVVDVALDDQGAIDHVRTREHGDVSGDLYIDCTGFRSLLVNKALQEPFISFQNHLPNDSAVALRVPVDMAVHGIRPATTATATDAGWIWTIPLFERLGTGYVYASEYSTPDEAERKLREFVGPAADNATANHIKMRIGRSERAWVKNCVAIGLSNGFVEPLESTGIFIIQNGIEQLVKNFPVGQEATDEGLRRTYNLQAAHVMDGLREFMVLHWYASRRTDNQYWRDTKTREIPDGLAERLEQWKVKLPDQNSLYPHYHGFESYSYRAIILGMGGLPVQPLPVLGLLDGTAADREFRLVADQAAALVEKLPSQYEYFAHLHGLPPAQRKAGTTR
ncbi:tryptophan halogenase family protein [Streptacidiphilus sp. P02-A3a]|uniref:tryptophan halogenase family protein n=1 Tax=Streptacidiphilus sp. P02-A3a TaxID=2704468 RepID=UPI0015FAED64|nr:tryptophan halogenase family protein [Streptacidiphilus sp. P02-A3a]QMU70368.1 tryptophan 7-halogenase [Streptacidiphilus sp. P02-A3a]